MESDGILQKRRETFSPRKTDRTETNRRLLIFAKDQLRRHKFLSAGTLNMERISAQIPGNAVKLIGFIYDVLLAIMIDEIIQKVK